MAQATLKNQMTIMAGLKEVVANQRKILRNQEFLPDVIGNQLRIIRNQDAIIMNQKKIMANQRRGTGGKKRR